MKRKTGECLGAAACIAALFCCSTAVAGPQNGFGIYVGAVGASEGGAFSRGVSLGGDAQFTVNDEWSLVPYLMVSRENSSAVGIVSDELAGLQLRRWFGEYFVGVQGVAHDRLLVSNGTVQRSSYGPAGGFAAGVEFDSGWGAELQTELYENTGVAGVWRNTVRAHVTYRWR